MIQPAAPSAPWRRWIWWLLASALLIQAWTLPAQGVNRLAHVHARVHLVARLAPQGGPAAAAPVRRAVAAARSARHAAARDPARVQHGEATQSGVPAWAAPPRRSLFEHRHGDDDHPAPWPVAPATIKAPAATATVGTSPEPHGHAGLAFHEHDHDDASVVHIDAQGRHSAATAAPPASTQRGLNEGDALPLPARQPAADRPRPVWVGDAPARFQSHIGSLLLPPPRRTA